MFWGPCRFAAGTDNQEISYSFLIQQKRKKIEEKKETILLCTEYAPGLLGYQYLGSRSGSVIFFIKFVI